MSTSPLWGLSLVGRHEGLEPLDGPQRWGLSALRLPVHLPLRRTDIALLESAHNVHYVILAVLKFSPRDVQWKNGLVEAVRQLPFITHWEIESEADDPVFGWPDDGLVTYAACFIEAAALIKTVHRQAQIHNGGLGRSLPKGIARLCELGADQYIDIWNVHPYMNPLMPDAKGCLRYFHDIIKQTITKEGQAAKPLWWSSVACPGMIDPKAAPDWWLGKNPTENMQAEWIKALYALATQADIERIFWEGWKDQPGQTKTGMDYFGLVRPDLSFKPALDTLRQLQTA